LIAIALLNSDTRSQTAAILARLGWGALIEDVSNMSRCSQWGWRLGTAFLVIVTSAVAGRPREAFAQGRGGFSVPGLVEPADGVLSIGTAATGVISSIVARPGEHVRQGEEIVRIDCAPLEASVKSLEDDAAGPA
jgi:multidrug efflux pump subunit AcrA (membrane-fusion protein)